MDRGRERRYQSDRLHGGETYRPSDRNEPPARSNFRDARSPPQRGRTPPPYSERYASDFERKRSRSPTYMGRDEVNSRRQRSPFRRGFSPRREGREARIRSPTPRARRYSRSPIRVRSPPPFRRDSPILERRPRSPPPSRRRAPSPRERFERKPISPSRDTRSKYSDEADFRRRDRSRSPLSRRPNPHSRVESPVSSHISSPSIHPDRLAQANSRPRSPSRRDARYATNTPSVALRTRSPLPSKTYSPISRSPPRNTALRRSPPRRDANEASSSDHAKYTDTFRPPQSSSDARPAPSRQPETPNSSARDPPTGPASAKPIPISAHSRPGSASILSAPTRPRGGSSAMRADSRDHAYGGPPSHRGGRPPPATSYQSSRYSYDSRGSPADRVPNGPRSSHAGAPPHAPPFRSNNSSSTTYPRTQRFSTTNHLASIPPIIPGGSLLPSADPAAARKISQLEEDAEKLRKQIDDKQKEKRAGLRDWDVRERESRREGLRSELAEAQLESFNGEIIGGQAF